MRKGTARESRMLTTKKALSGGIGGVKNEGMRVQVISPHFIEQTPSVSVCLCLSLSLSLLSSCKCFVMDGKR